MNIHRHKAQTAAEMDAKVTETPRAENPVDPAEASENSKLTLPPIRKSSTSSIAPQNEPTKRKSSIKPIRKMSNTALKMDTLASTFVRKRSNSSMVSLASSLREKVKNKARAKNESHPDLKEVVSNIDFAKLDTKEKTQERIEEYIQSEIKLLYQSLDINGNEFLSPEEVKWAFHFFRKTDITMEDAIMICEELSGQKGAEYPTVTAVDFAKEMHETMSNNITESEVRLIFDVMDVNSQDFVGPTGIIHLFQKFGVHMDEKEAFDVLDEICKSSVNGNRYGVFDFEQFRCYINRFDTTYGQLKNHYWTLLNKEL